MLNKIPTWLLILLPGLLFWLGWPPNYIFVSLFFAFIPLFELQKRNLQKKGIIYFLQLYTALLIWNIALTWWVWNSTAPGAVVMLVLNTLFMCFPWLLYRFIQKRTGEKSVYLFIIFWLSYEFLHHRWDLSWPWLTLGNGLAGMPWLVQWYDITGTLGGSAFELGMNILIWQALQNPTRKTIILPIGLFAFVFISSVFNGWKFDKYFNPKTDAVNVVAMQSNFDPWNEKFVRDPSDLIREMQQISAPALDSNTDLLVWPETSVTASIDVDHIQNDGLIIMLQQFRNKYKNLNILTGSDMQKIYHNAPKRPSGTARKTDDPNTWWDAFNSALFIDKNNHISYYHKSILVPGTEQMPFVDKFPFIEDLAVKMDEHSISGSLGKSDSHRVFQSGKLKITPAICYEGIYGNHVGEFINQGANLIAIITNDAWWGNTPIYPQHLYYGRLRAIEHRKWIVRSANSGISGFLDPLGNIVNAADKFQKVAVKQKVYLNNYKTIYTKLGDTWILVILSICCILLWIKSKL